jgi:hypothetical protein
MDLLGHLLGSEGCNVDGSIGSNPFTSLVDHVFESNFADFGQMPAENAVFVEESMGMYQEGQQQVREQQYIYFKVREALTLLIAI